MEMDRPPAYKCTWVEDRKQEIYLEWPDKCPDVAGVVKQT